MTNRRYRIIALLVALLALFAGGATAHTIVAHDACPTGWVKVTGYAGCELEGVN